MSRHAAAIAEEPVGYETYADVNMFGRGVMAAEQEAALADLRRTRLGELGLTELADQEAGKSQEYLAEVQSQLNGTRAALRQLSPAHKDSLEGYLSKHLDKAGVGREKHGTRADWLSDDTNGASDKQLFDFLSAHVDNIVKQQRSPEFQAAVKESKAKTVLGIRKAVAQGSFSDHALQQIPQIESLPVYVGDLWDRYIGQGAAGFYRDGYIVIAQAKHNIADDRDSAIHDLQSGVAVTTPHEIDHPIFGRWEARWLREGLAEHDALSYDDGMFYAIRPSLRGEADSGVYVPERELIAVLCEETSTGVNVSTGMVTRAHTSAGPESAEWQSLMNAWDKAWNTTDVYGQVTGRIDQLTEYYCNANPDQPYRVSQSMAVERMTKELRNDRAIMKQTPVEAPV